MTNIPLYAKLFGLLKGTSEKSDNVYMGGYYHTYVNTPGKPVWTNREYNKFSDEGFIKNVVANRSITMIAKGASSVKWQLFYRNDSDEVIELKNHPLLTLLNHPNPCMSGAEFFEMVYSHKLISGNSFVQSVRPSGGRPEELYALRPDRVQVIAGKGCLPEGYRYTVGDTVKTFPVNKVTGQSDILHMKNFHPLNDWYGLSSIEPAAYSIDQHNQAAQWNQALLQNGARPSGALIVKGGDKGDGSYLSDNQYNHLKGQIDDMYSGAANAGRPMLLEGGLEWREMSLSPKDMDFIETKNSAARDIALAFGVPPQLLGIQGDNTYNNMAEARLSLWEQTILPLLDNMASALNNWLVPQYGEQGLKVTYNVNAISALALRREALWKRVNDATFLTESEKREIVGV